MRLCNRLAEGKFRKNSSQTGSQKVFNERCGFVEESPKAFGAGDGCGQNGASGSLDWQRYVAWLGKTEGAGGSPI